MIGAGHRRWSRRTTRRGSSGGTAGPATAGAGRRAAVHASYACLTCHKADATGARPDARRRVRQSRCTLADGRTVVADENYLRESIMNPRRRSCGATSPIMPTFQGMVTEEKLMQLIAYIKTLKPAAGQRRRRSRQ